MAEPFPQAGGRGDLLEPAVEVRAELEAEALALRVIREGVGAEALDGLDRAEDRAQGCARRSGHFQFRIGCIAAASPTWVASWPRQEA